MAIRFMTVRFRRLGAEELAFRRTGLAERADPGLREKSRPLF